jgi:hypothetical protein
MNGSARAMIGRIRKRGFRVLFECNYDGSIAVMAISPTREAYVVRGRLCDDSRIIQELAQMLDVYASARNA